MEMAWGYRSCGDAAPTAVPVWRAALVRGPAFAVSCVIVAACWLWVVRKTESVELRCAGGHFQMPLRTRTWLGSVLDVQ